MKKIQAVPEFAFNKAIDDEFIESKSHCAFISIVEPFRSDYSRNIKEFKHHDNFLRVYMHDVEDDFYDQFGGIKIEKPSDTELQEIVDFVEKHKDKKAFIIHCAAGISRSGAVATYIKERFIDEVDKEEFLRTNRQINPNLYILNRLRELTN